MRWLFAIAVALVAAACGGTSKQQDTSPQRKAAPVELELGDFKLIDVNKNAAIVVTAAGGIVVDDRTIAMVTKDGKIVLSGTNETFTLHGDGTITDPSGQELEVTLSADAVIKIGDKTVSLDDAGNLLGANPDAPQLKVEGATTPGLKRTALFVLIAWTTPKTKS